MLIRKFAIALAAAGVVGIVSPGGVFGQWSGSSDRGAKKSLMDHLDSLGRSVFGKAFPQKDHRGSHPESSHSATRKTQSQSGRSGSARSSGTKPAHGASGAALADRPLHERLKRFRKSAFSEQTEGRSTTFARPPDAVSPSHDTPTPAQRRTSASTTTGRAGRPVIARQPLAAAPLEESLSRDMSRSAPTEGLPIAIHRTRVSNRALGSNDGQAIQAKSSDGVLLDGKGPALSVQTAGPRTISVGKESKYELILRNTGDTAADDVVVLVDIPEWTDLLVADASVGATQPAMPGQDSRPFEWRVGRVEAGTRQGLTLRIVPRQSRDFDLAVRWHYKPVASQVTIEVQEPKLLIGLEGPREVLYGKSEVYKLKIANTGTGEAENVTINLTPMGSG